MKVEGEMDLLRIRTSDFGHNHTITSHLHDYKTEPPVSPTSQFSCNTSPSSTTSSSSSSSSICVKQEPNNNQSQNVANFLIKTELPDPHFNDSQNTTNFKNCVALPISVTPTPTEDTSPDKLIVGSTSQFLPDCSNKNLFECVIYVKGDTTIAKSGLIRQGIENQVDYPPEVANDQRKISELASWLQAPPSRGNKIVFHQPGQEHSHTTGHNHLHHQHHTFTTQATAGTGPLLRNNTTTWPKSAPTSPLSPGSPTDNRIIRSASSSPIRQTVLPNPCCRQKPFNRSASVGQSEPILSSQNASSNHLIDGEPVAKRRPVTSIATLGPIRSGTAFTPISIPDSSQNTFSSIPFERIQESTLLNTSQEVQIGMLPEQITGMRLPTETGQSILITSAPPSNTTTQTGPTKVQHIVVRDTNIKQEYFVDNSSEITTIQTNNANMMSNNNDHIRSQRTGRKCRKVYGVNNRHEWCTACRWKKACRRFPS